MAESTLMTVRPLSPYLIVPGAAKAIKFYTEAFGAKERFRMSGPGDMIGHAEMLIGESNFMLSDENPEWGALGPAAIGGTPVMMSLYVEDVDAVVERAVELGATIEKPAKDEFYGDRAALIVDPFGHKWHLATQLEELTPEEMQRRMDEMFE